jgi:tryptophan-rich protein
VVGAIAIESNGVTSLTAVGSNYYLFDSTGTGPSLKYNGAAYAAGYFSGWSPISAEKTSTGYLVAWKQAGADQYSIWTTDNTGNYISSTVKSGSNLAVISAETVLHQDLNGDGSVGPVTTPPLTGTAIESNGVTSLTAVGSNYYLFDSTGTGPSLKYNGAAYAAGYFSGWSPISAEKTSTGYLVAWKQAGADQYSIWTTDNTGNYISSTVKSGSSSAVISAETALHQDLNGDGVIAGAAAAPAAIVTGNVGNDTLISTAANEVMFGNGGNNTFVFTGNFGKDTIADFHPDTDVLQFSRSAFTDVADALAHAAQVGNDVTVTVDAEHSVTLTSTVLSHLNPHNIHIV